ncbi:MAG: hypothetical protein A3G75_03960, partial [Verrucomicrobia bacterium RIFCSPLOWO2_12_FULL_64_8]
MRRCFLATALCAAACASNPGTPRPQDTEPKEYPGLHNVVAYGDRIFCGSVPHGEEGFATLAAMGVRTIVSVDGAQPEVEAAKRHGLRTIHLPIGYAGVDDLRRLELARVVDAIEGSIYMHCHHGLHRSAAAAAAATVQLGILTPDEATGRMRISGTSPKYPGLYACANVTRADARRLAAIGTDFPERALVTGLVQSMVEIDIVTNHLVAVDRAGWTVPAVHPDLVPAVETGRMADLFRHLPDDPEVRAKPSEFGRLLELQIEATQAV